MRIKTFEQHINEGQEVPADLSMEVKAVATELFGMSMVPKIKHFKNNIYIVNLYKRRDGSLVYKDSYNIALTDALSDRKIKGVSSVNYSRGGATEGAITIRFGEVSEKLNAPYSKAQWDKEIWFDSNYKELTAFVKSKSKEELWKLFKDNSSDSEPYGTPYQIATDIVEALPLDKLKELLGEK